MRSLVLCLAALALAACHSGSSESAVAARVLEHGGRWESGYGAKFYSVVGRLQNTSARPLRYVKLRIEALDPSGKVVASSDTYNESAEALGVPEVDGQALLASGKVKPVPPGAEERFRGGFMSDETPAFSSYRVVVVEASAAP
jgi:hypothetical protein